MSNTVLKSILHSVATSELTLGLADECAELPAPTGILRIGGLWRRKRDTLPSVGKLHLHSLVYFEMPTFSVLSRARMAAQRFEILVVAGSSTRTRN